jgi:capsular polysaccharide biosynthesis protein
LELRRYLTVLRGRIWLILITTFVAGAVAYVTSDSAPLYSTRSTLYVGSTSIDVDPDRGELSNDRTLALQSIALTFSKMIDSQPIAARAIERLDLDVTADHVVAATQATHELGTQLIYIDVTDPDPAVAHALANGIADAFVEIVQEFEPTNAAEGDVPRLPAYVFERAQLPQAPQATGQLRTVLLGMMFGFLVGAGLAFLLDYLDLSVRTSADVERLLELPVLGVIPALPDDVPLGQWGGTRVGTEVAS